MTGPSVRAHISADKCLKDLRALERRTDRASRAGIRAVGLRVAAVGRKGAPVYQGKPRKVSYGDGHSGELVRGELKKSIKPGRRAKRMGPDSYRLRVGPRGGHVHLYAAKQEERLGFMQAAQDVADREAVAIHAKAWDKAIKRK